MEAANYVKLYLTEGEIDFVAAPNLTSPGFVIDTIMGRSIRVETSVEIIAKKMWHRGDRITGRDIFDFALIAEKEKEALMAAGAYMTRHAEAVFKQLDERYQPLEMQFNAIDTISYHPAFDESVQTLRELVALMRAQARSVHDR